MFFLLLGIAAVSVTTVINLVVIWWVGRLRKQPLWLLVLVFFWGAIPAVVTALIFSVFASVPIYLVVGPTASMLAYAVFGAPFIEEVAKAGALIILFVLLFNEFEDILDGMVFGAAVGIGFAYTEDITYLLASLVQGGPAAMSFVFFLRVFVFALNHAFFTALTGIGLGLARLSGRWLAGLFYGLFGLFSAMAAHAAHNFLVSISTPEAQLVGVVFSIVVHWTVAAAFVILLLAVWAIEMGWIRRELAEEVAAGYVTNYEVKNLTRFFNRLKLQMIFALNFDIIGLFRIRKLKNLLVKLAFKREVYERDARESAAAELRSLRAGVASLREKLTGTGRN